MPVTIEEEVVLLYALYFCGRKPSRGRATQFIITNHLLKEKEGDSDTVSTGQPRVENRIDWTRENLKRNGELAMPRIGIWALTPKGIDRIEKIAVRSLRWGEPDDRLHGVDWDRFSDEFLTRLRALGKDLKGRSEKKGEQDSAPKAGSAGSAPASAS
jgi:hypothetical protein